MKLFLLAAALVLALGLAQEETELEGEIETVFLDLLTEEGTDIDDEAYAYRLGVFTVSYLAADEGEQPSLEWMFTDAEMSHQNGAKMVHSLKNDEVLQKREEDELLELTRRGTPPAYNSLKLIGPAVNQETCGNCYLHTFVAALEIANRKGGGGAAKFSEQEMTDCYNNGCEGGDFRMVAVHVGALDKLSTKAAYGKYMDGQYTCRSGTTPDGLKRVKVTGYVSVTPANIEAAIVKYGSVMTCMEWGSSPGDACYMSGYTNEVVDYPEVVGGCAHAVLIVGYTPAYYIVRNSHGTSWGLGGNFKIRRNTNSCGIEELMAAVVTEPRGGPKPTARNGCPKNKPKFCAAINSCVAGNQPCQAALNRVLEEEVEEIEIEEREARIPGKLRRILKERSLTDEEIDNYYKRSETEVVELEERCTDDSPSRCRKANKKKLCRGAGAKSCAKTCNKCGGKKTAPAMTKETIGNCLKPKIPNGRVTNSGNVLRPGDALAVKCAPGFQLVGAATCVIQNVFTNDAKDGRILPECIKLGSDSLVGNGASYTGAKNTFPSTHPLSGATSEVECDNWDVDVLRGLVIDDIGSMALALGNHNYCRNPGGAEPVPYCLTNEDSQAKKRYCFKAPGCDACGAADIYSAGECAPRAAAGKCDYTDTRTKAQVDFSWTNCAATCCAHAGC